MHHTKLILSNFRARVTILAAILGMILVSHVRPEGTTKNSENLGPTLPSQFPRMDRLLQVPDTKAKDCFWYNFQQNLRTQILPNSIFYEKIYEIALDEGVSAVVSLCKQIGPEHLKDCPHDDAPHKYVIVAKPSCNIYRQDDAIDGWKFPSVNKNTIREFQGLIELRVTKRPSSLRSLVALSPNPDMSQHFRGSETEPSHGMQTDRSLQDSQTDHRVTKTSQGNYLVELFYDNDSQLGTITDPLYNWPVPFLMPWIVLV